MKDSTGRLVVDQHTGYNAVTKPGGRVRAGCLAHARRKIFEQKEHPETKEALDLIAEIYRVERDAKSASIVGTEEHLALRRFLRRAQMRDLPERADGDEPGRLLDDAQAGRCPNRPYAAS